MGEPLAYDVAEVQGLTTLGRTKIMELIASGELASVKVGRRRLIPRQALEEFLARKLSEAQAVSA